MNANELIIGDLVTFKDCQNDEAPSIVKIWQINAAGDALVSIDGDDALDEIVIDDEVVGIPLTPEILEKNGFDWGYTASEEEFCSATGCGYPEEKGWCFDEGAGEIKIIFPNDTDGGLIRLDDQCVDRHLEILFLKPIYVHELQHALRLCGIEKEIEL